MYAHCVWSTVTQYIPWQVYHGDVCDSQLLHYLMITYNFTDVVHMAAQAGVRYSLEDPQAYVSANYECFIALLDTLVQFPVSACLLLRHVMCCHTHCHSRPIWCTPHHPVSMERGHLFLSLLKSHSGLLGTSMLPLR